MKRVGHHDFNLGARAKGFGDLGMWGFKLRD